MEEEGGGRSGKGNQGGEEGPGEDGNAGCKATECYRVQEGRETALYMSIAIPTFLGCPEWRKRRDGAYETMRSRILRARPRVCSGN